MRVRPILITFCFLFCADVVSAAAVNYDIVSIAVSGVRTRYNERGDLLIATTPPVDRTAAPANSEMVFPHIVSGGGCTTRLILLGVN